MRTRFTFYAFGLCLTALFPLCAQANEEEESAVAAANQQTPIDQTDLSNQTIQGKVLEVISGETFTLSTPDNNAIEVWLAEVEAPAYGQRHWAASTQALADKLGSNTVTIQVISKRGFEEGKPHLIAQVFLGDRWINKEMVAEGMAWNFPEYLKSDELTAAEQQAKEMHLGVWAE